ncbi:MAG: VCBS repeat-containing protein [Bryobacterales bacterium]|nr:VCBS repeat-containing protein [Bryobacterales bacterium]
MSGGCRSTEQPTAEESIGTTVPEERALFREAAEATGLRFRHFTGSTGRFYMPEIMGAGVAVFDYDNDGDLDVSLPQGAMLDRSVPPASSAFPPEPGQKRGHRFFRNELLPSGALRFTDVTEQAGLGQGGYGMGAAVGHYDNDGFLDLYVTQFGSNISIAISAMACFEDVTRRAGVDQLRSSTSATFADYDRDGRYLATSSCSTI